MTQYANVILSLLVITLTAYSQIVLRFRMQKLSDTIINNGIGLKNLVLLSTDLFVLSSVAAFGLSFLFWSIALSNNLNMAKIYPIVVALTVMVVTAANFYIFHDKVQPINIFGFLFIILGVLLTLK